MKRNDPRSDLPANVCQKLVLIQRRARMLKLIEGVVKTGAVLITAMIIAMFIDLVTGWFDPRARYSITGITLGGIVALGILWCALPLLRRRSIVSTAREVDQTVPQLQERWSTVTELAQSTDAPEVRGSEAMIRRIASEAESASDSIDPEKIVSSRPALNAAYWMLGTAVVLALMLTTNLMHSRVLLRRFWMPGADISLTELHASPKDAWAPRGELLNLTAVVNGCIPKQPPQLMIRRTDAPEKSLSMSANTSEPRTFQHSIAELSDSFEYRMRAGDGQTPWYRITAVDRPEITAVKLVVTPPAYSRLEKDEKTSLPNAVRVLEGSEVALAFKSGQPLDKMVLDLGEGRTAVLTEENDGWYRYSSTPADSFTFAVIATSRFNLENKHKPSCLVTVYKDLAPSVKILAPSDELAVLPNEKVNVTFEAKDDFGLAKAELVVTTTTAEGETNTRTLPIDLNEDLGKTQVRKSVELDPKALGLKHGDQLSYVVQVTDTKQNPAQAVTASPTLASNGTPDAQAPKDGEQKPESDNSERNAADEQKESNGNPQKNDSSLTPKVTAKNQETPANRNTRPADQMSRRMLDAGQCTACKPRNLVIDEWAGSFEGEKRKKLEIAIAPVLEQLATLLQKAEEQTTLLEKPASSPQGLQSAHAEPLSGAQGNLGESEKAIADLKVRTTGTPYAFVGLQLHNIGGAHVTPAHGKLGQVVIAAAPAHANVELIESGLYHIGRAREMLEGLTRTFEQVKRDQKIADAMQRLAKMHQLFIEDTQALLKSSQGPINSYNRKVAEVDDQFVEKLKAMLEEKKKIMDELAKLLAEDPRLLRRFLAMQQMHCSSYRDQMTLLAERQKKIQQQVAKWNATPETERGTLLQELKQTFATEQGKVTQDAAELREKMETWLPLDVKPDQPKVAAALLQAEKIMQLMSGAIRPESAVGSGEQAAEELRALRTTLASFNEIGSKDKARMAAYIANRLTEIETLISVQSGQTKISASLGEGNFAKVAEVTQHAIAADTTTLGEKLAITEKQVARLSEEIAKKASLLNKTVQSDIVSPQLKSVTQFAEQKTDSAGEILNAVVPAFATAEDTFDELMRMIIEKLDEAPAPGSPGQAPQLDSLLAMLQDEMKACESLGIPCRPMNVSVMTDWIKPGNGQGMMQGQAQAQAAQAQSQQAKAEAERLEKQARESAQNALAAAKKPTTGEERTSSRASGWNKLASKLKKEMLQGRDSTPPEQYRAAIESYFKTLSEVPASAGE
ncbi:hypothetical protein ACXR0O_23210 [Verrucomicrobiota bacterium sgz303538]